MPVLKISFGKSIKKRRVTFRYSSLFLAARDSHQTKPNDIDKKDYLSFEAITKQTRCFRNRATKLFFIFYLVYF